MEKREAMKKAKKWIRSKPMPSSLEAEFKRNGWKEWLDKVYLRTAELVPDSEDAPKEVLAHLEQILPSIAFYEILLEKEGSKERALEVFEKHCYIKLEKMSKMIQIFLKIPALYREIPSLMYKMVHETFHFIEIKYSAIVLCSVATFSAIQEGHFIRIGKEIV